jgi:hypothetical protein
MADRILLNTTPAEAARLDRLAELAEQDKDDMLERLKLHEIAAA